MQQFYYAALLSTPGCILNGSDGLENHHDPDQVGFTSPPIAQRLSYGQRAIRMESYLSRGTTFKCRGYTTSSQFLEDLDHTSFTPDQRATLITDYIQRRGTPCCCGSALCPLQSISAVESLFMELSNPWSYPVRKERCRVLIYPMDGHEGWRSG